MTHKRVGCKMPGCTNPRHVYPSGYDCQYCREHMRYRKSKYREGKDTMTGVMLDVLTYLHDMKQADKLWVEVTYPLAHKKTLKGLLDRDWIFGSTDATGTRYKITLRGEEALAAYSIPAQRRDGICSACGVNERSTKGAYCKDCESAYRKKLRQMKRPRIKAGRPCSRCHQRPVHTNANGVTITYCIECERERAALKTRKRQVILRERIAAGEIVLCATCKERPVAVTEKCVYHYCRECFYANGKQQRARRKSRHARKLLAA